ncbi:uncharacterized protein [Brachyistius frenatus]|uniref:uncharacterized protein n=1 Tax=Brachyistius frenatus TaxID=100188 RepID=UPI0037E94C65
MVHSGSASPMKTTPSTSPFLTVSATAHPLVPPPGGTTDPDLTQTPIKLLTTDLTASSDLTQPSTLTPADAEPPVVTPAKAFNTNSCPASVWASIPTPTPGQGQANGRTSGRKRTPKACDCCGPNGKGHDVKTSSRGKGRGKGRGRGAGRDLGDTPKRKVGQLTRIKSFDLTMEKEEEAEEEDDAYEKVQTSVAVADIQSQTPCTTTVTISLPEGPIRNCVAPEKGDVQRKEDMMIGGSGGPVAGDKGGEDSRDVEMRLLGSAGRGELVVRGRGGGGGMRAMMAPKMEVNVEIKRGVTDGAVISSKTALAEQWVNQDAQMLHGDQNDSGSVKFGNGDTVNLSDSEGEVEDSMIVTVPGDGLLSISLQSRPALRSGTPQDLDSEIEVDKIPDRTDQDSLLVTLSNGNVTTPTDHHRRTTPMDMETSQVPITMSIMHYRWALRDHKLYCQPGTWEKDEMEEMLGKNQPEETAADGKTQNKETLEQLTDMIHEFLENFYLKYGSFIPLSETDVLEHLKKKGNSDLSNSGLDIKGEMTRYRAGLASAPIAGFMVMYNKHTLSLEDLGTLEEQNWLNDQIINMYGELIMEATEHKVHFFNSFFHKQLVAKGYDGVKRWTKKVDLFSKWLLLIPIHLEIHWSLVTVTMATKTISYYDSQGIVFRHTTDNIMKYLQSEAREKKHTAFQKGWKITIIKGIPQQKNDSDCGVFVLEYCRRLSVKQPLLFSQEDMPHIRKSIYKELCDCRLNH